jgi:ankyrin repeat protein
VDSQDPVAIAAVQAIRSGDWPGYFPAGPAIVRLLIETGADPDAVVVKGAQAETPLHWAASSDVADVADALISGGVAAALGIMPRVEELLAANPASSAEAAAEPGTQRENLIAWLHDGAPPGPGAGTSP